MALLMIHHQVDCPQPPWISRLLLKVPKALLDRTQPWICGLTLAANLADGIDYAFFHVRLALITDLAVATFVALGFWLVAQHTRIWWLGVALQAEGEALRRLVREDTQKNLGEAMRAAIEGREPEFVTPQVKH